MVEQDQAGPAAGGYAGWMTKRNDRMTAFYVDLAINLARSHGIAAGARALFQLGLPVELARRVLLRPAERRGTAAVRSIQPQPLAAGRAPAR